jgi:hypothetical protein
MSKLRGVGVGLVFLLGCAVGGAAGQLVAPPASAQQAATLTRWEYSCFEENRANDVAPKANALGVQFWEMAAVQSQGMMSTWCFKRPRL